MRNITGGVARGSDFFDRSVELAEVIHLLERDHLLLLAPRRVGKTSLMYRLADAPPSGWNVVYADAQSARSEAEFVARLLEAVYTSSPPGARWQRLGQGIDQILGRIGKVGAGPVQVELVHAIGEHWQDTGDRLLSLVQGADPTLLLIDEFPIFVQRLLDTAPNGVERAQLFLDWFRALRIGHAHEAGSRFLLAGSIGLDGVVSRAGLSSTINDLVSFRLPPLDPVRARRLLDALCDGENFPMPADVIDHFLARIDWPVPFHLQLLFSQVLRAAKFHGADPTSDLVDRCYDELLATDMRKHFAHWEERLGLFGPTEEPLARAVLAAAARDPQGVDASILSQLRIRAGRTSADLNALMPELEHDGYLTRDGPRWRFASSLVRDWWVRRIL